MPPEERLTEGTIREMFRQIKDDLADIKKDNKEAHRDLHGRCNTIEECINKEVKPDVHQNKADIGWLKRGFWTLTGMGISALLLVIGVIISNAIGG